MKKFDIWNPENELMNQAYEQDNYQCVDTGINSDICYIFFSGHGLYYPDTKEQFEETIIRKDRYEWKWMVNNSKILSIAGRVIFVRDIHKKCYAVGISKKNNTIDKTLDEIRRLTKGYRVITVGSSGGGYMASLAAVCLPAEYCISFAGPFDVTKVVEGTDVRDCYKDITELVRNYHGKIFFFMAAHADFDSKVYEGVKGIECIKPFIFNGRSHADTMFAGNMRYIIDKNEDELMELYKIYDKKMISKFVFLFQTVIFKEAIKVLKREIYGFWMRRQGKHYNGI